LIDDDLFCASASSRIPLLTPPSTTRPVIDNIDDSDDELFR
jgi:hypothetical protein